MLIAFGLLIAGGYALHWRWTGFAGNTLWDWFSSCLAPALFGILDVPAAVAWVAKEIEEHEEEDRGTRAGEGGNGSTALTARYGLRAGRQAAPTRRRRRRPQTIFRCPITAIQGFPGHS